MNIIDKLDKQSSNGNLEIYTNYLDRNRNKLSKADYQAIYTIYATKMKQSIENGDSDLRYFVLDTKPDFYTASEYNFIDAAKNGDNLELYINNGINVQVFSNYALIQSINIGSYDNVKILLDNKANIHTTQDTYVGIDIEETALIVAIKNDHLDIVKLLVSYGANIHVQDENPLITSIRFGNYDIAKYLLSVGANVNGRNGNVKKWWFNDDTILTTICLGRDLIKYNAKYALDMLCCLIKAGANIHARNNFALVKFVKYGDIKIIKCLLENGAKY